MRQLGRFESTSPASCLHCGLPALAPEHFVPVHAEPGAISLCRCVASFPSRTRHGRRTWISACAGGARRRRPST